MRIRIIVIIASALLVAADAHAWNSLGHKVVAEIAWQQLDAPTRQSIVDTLRRHPRFDTDFIAKMEDSAANSDKAVQDHWIFQHAATWPDEIRKKKPYDHPTWHYINLPIYLHSVDKAVLFATRLNPSDKYSRRGRTDQLNILQALGYSRETIAGKAGPADKAIAYCWLLHLVGDIHQPLHSSALFSVEMFPNGDEGGNKILLTKGKNLHSVWDGLLGKQYYMRNVDKVVKELSNRDRFGEVFDTAARETEPAKWANESHELCRSVVYTPEILNAVKKTPAGEKIAPLDLPVEYYKAAGELARKRVLAAGLRLGALLKNANQ